MRIRAHTVEELQHDALVVCEVQLARLVHAAEVLRSRIPDAVQVVLVSSVRHIEEERSSSFHLVEHVEVLLPSYSHVGAERQCMRLVDGFPDALEFRLHFGLVQNGRSACALHRSRWQLQAGPRSLEASSGARGTAGALESNVVVHIWLAPFSL